MASVNGGVPKNYLTVDSLVSLAGSADDSTRNLYHAYLDELGVKPGERPSAEVCYLPIIGRETCTTPGEDWAKRKVEVYSMVGGRLHTATVTVYRPPYRNDWDDFEPTVVEKSEAEHAGLL
jgi:hypothetical protein